MNIKKENKLHLKLIYHFVYYKYLEDNINVQIHVIRYQNVKIRYFLQTL